jgi:DNA invertase Pin-like site-specific DNA recombinase
MDGGISVHGPEVSGERAMTIYGDARVSTDGQTLDTQRVKFTEAGEEKIFAEKESGAKTDRKALQDALKTLRPGVGVNG